MSTAGEFELAVFHRSDRSMFQRLVRDLGQDAESMRWVMALWLWFETVGHDGFIRRVSAMPGPVVIRFVEEALACLARLARLHLADARALLPCTNALLAKPIDDVEYFDTHRAEVTSGVRSIYNNICRVIFNDSCVADDAIFLPRSSTTGIISNTGGYVSRAVGTPVVPAFAGPLHTAASYSGLNAMAAPWSPVPAPVPVRAAYKLPRQQPILVSPVPEEFRSLFITFSRGYPISKEDIEEFFNAFHGPCVVAVMVERAPAGQLPLYGRVVLRNPTMIPVLLGGQQTAKYVIKGRHLWARIYEPTARNPTSLP